MTDRNMFEYNLIKSKLQEGMQKRFDEKVVIEAEARDFDAQLDEISRHQKITVDPCVETKKLGLYGKLVVLFKRFCRKVVAWYLQPVCDEQTGYNHMIYTYLCNKNLNDEKDLEQRLEWERSMELRMQQLEEELETTKKLLATYQKQK